MNFKQFGVLVSVSTLLGINVAATKALAQEESITFGEAIAAPGCVIADQLVGPDGRSLSLLFTDFEAENGNRKTCNIRINTTIPSGFFVQDLQFLYQGSAEVPSGTKAPTLSRRYTFQGGALGTTKTPAKVTRFTSDQPLFAEQDDVTAVAASCGGEGKLGINMVAQSGKGNSIIVDTADVNAGLIVRIELASCE